MQYRLHLIRQHLDDELPHEQKKRLMTEWKHNQKARQNETEEQRTKCLKRNLTAPTDELNKYVSRLAY